MIAHWRLLARLRRAERALRWIGTRCSTHTNLRGRKQARCWDDDRTPDADYTADKWCDECIAAYGLGVAHPDERWMRDNRDKL